MPVPAVPPVAHYEPSPETQGDIDYAEVPIIDFAKVGTPEGRAELAPKVRDAMRTYGFMCIVRHGRTQAQRGQNDRMIDIADVAFSEASEDEQHRLLSKVRELGEWKGYKPRQFWHLDNGVRDQIQSHAMVRPALEQQHPRALYPFLPEIHAFIAHTHLNVVHPILRLLALGLELPEETFLAQHRFDAEGMTFYEGPYGQRIGLASVSQPVVVLQIMSPDKWRFVKHIPIGIIVNAGDAKEMLSGGYYKATIHRVVQPPADQQGHTHLGLFYFAYANADVKLVSFKESPVLQLVGITRNCDGEDAPTMKVWGYMRASKYGHSAPKRKENGVEEEVMNGVVIKHFN